MKHDSSGFTLIEMAIVLVVIGLLLGATIKGQELINSSKLKRLLRDFHNIPVSIEGYQDKFRAFPGDDAGLAMHLTGATPCSPQGVAGKCMVGNGMIDGGWSDSTIASESYVMWQHLRLAGLETGSTDTSNLNGDYIPRNIVGGKIGVTSSSPIIGLSGTYIICSDNILGKFAKQLDDELDDGNTATGYIRVVDAGTTVPANPYQTININDNDLYLVCMGV